MVSKAWGDRPYHKTWPQSVFGLVVAVLLAVLTPVQAPARAKPAFDQESLRGQLREFKNEQRTLTTLGIAALLFSDMLNDAESESHSLFHTIRQKLDSKYSPAAIIDERKTCIQRKISRWVHLASSGKYNTTGQIIEDLLQAGSGSRCDRFFTSVFSAKGFPHRSFLSQLERSEYIVNPTDKKLFILSMVDHTLLRADAHYGAAQLVAELYLEDKSEAVRKKAQSIIESIPKSKYINLALNMLSPDTLLLGGGAAVGALKIVSRLEKSGILESSNKALHRAVLLALSAHVFADHLTQHLGGASSDKAQIVQVPQKDLQPLDLAGASIERRFQALDNDFLSQDMLVDWARRSLQYYKRFKSDDFAFDQFFVEAEFQAVEDLPVTFYNGQLNSLRQLRFKAQELTRGASEDFTDVINAFRKIAINEGMRQRYHIESPRLIHLLGEKGGNCVANTKLLLSLTWHLRKQLPSPWKMGVQVFADHLQPVIFNPESKLVIDLVSSKQESGVVAPIYHPFLLLVSYLKKKGQNSPLEYSHLVLEKPPRSRFTGLEELLGISSVDNSELSAYSLTARLGLNRLIQADQDFLLPKSPSLTGIVPNVSSTIEFRPISMAKEAREKMAHGTPSKLGSGLSKVSQLAQLLDMAAREGQTGLEGWAELLKSLTEEQIAALEREWGQSIESVAGIYQTYRTAFSGIAKQYREGTIRMISPSHNSVNYQFEFMKQSVDLFSRVYAADGTMTGYSIAFSRDVDRERFRRLSTAERRQFPMQLFQQDLEKGWQWVQDSNLLQLFADPMNQQISLSLTTIEDYSDFMDRLRFIFDFPARLDDYETLRSFQEGMRFSQDHRQNLRIEFLSEPRIKSLSNALWVLANKISENPDDFISVVDDSILPNANRMVLLSIVRVMISIGRDRGQGSKGALPVLGEAIDKAIIALTDALSDPKRIGISARKMTPASQPQPIQEPVIGTTGGNQYVIRTIEIDMDRDNSTSDSSSPSSCATGKQSEACREQNYDVNAVWAADRYIKPDTLIYFAGLFSSGDEIAENIVAKRWSHQLTSVLRKKKIGIYSSVVESLDQRAGDIDDSRLRRLPLGEDFLLQMMFTPPTEDIIRSWIVQQPIGKAAVSLEVFDPVQSEMVDVRFGTSLSLKQLYDCESRSYENIESLRSAPSCFRQ